MVKGIFTLTSFKNRSHTLTGTLTFRLEETTGQYVDIFMEGAPYPLTSTPLLSTLASRWKSRTTKYVADLWELLHMPSSSSPSPEESALRTFLATHLKETFHVRG